MAQAVAEGAKITEDIQVDLNYFVEAGDLGDYDAILVGTPTYHRDMPMDMKMLFEEAAAKGVSLKGKPAAVFGSYGWSGEAPKLVWEILKNKFEMNLIDNPLIAKYTPDEDVLEQCKSLGKRVAESLIH